MHSSDESGGAHQVLPVVVVPGFGDTSDLPTLTALGGEDILASDPATAPNPDLIYAAALAVGRGWPDLDDHATAKSWLRAAIPTFEVESLIAFNNIVLTCAHALPDLADELAEAWEELSADSGLLGNVAIEAWTRLALAGWSDNLPVRAALGKRAKQAAVDAVEADIFLVRSLGAAMDVWPTEETRQALIRLAVLEDIECDVAFELAMDHVRQAVSVEGVTDAAASFAEARAMFERANLEGERPDAVAFAAVAGALDGFLTGHAVGADVLTRVHQAVAEWHVGYLGQVPEWRQARAETAGSWANVLADMSRLTELDEPWLDASSLFAAVGELFANHQATILVANPRAFPTLFGATVPPSLASTEDANAGLPVSFAPRIEGAFARSAASVQLVDRWLDAMTERLRGHDLPDAVEAIAGVRDRIRKRPTPGKLHASRESPLPGTIREALEPLLDEDQLNAVGDALAEFVKDFDQDAVAAATTGLRVVSLREEQLLKTLARELESVLPFEYATWSQHLIQLLTALIRVASIAIDREQGGKRNLPWHREEGEASAPEAALADYLALSIQLATGLRSHVEIPNIGGGRADVVIPIGTEHFVIEVKRITAPRDDDALTSEYGQQASEYTKTGAPFSFLAVLDLTHHSSRLDIGDSFWVVEWSDATGRKRAMTGLRVLASVSSPSASA